VGMPLVTVHRNVGIANCMVNFVSSTHFLLVDMSEGDGGEYNSQQKRGTITCHFSKCTYAFFLWP
jgi:hypothetical protein